MKKLKLFHKTVLRLGTQGEPFDCSTDSQNRYLPNISEFSLSRTGWHPDLVSYSYFPYEEVKVWKSDMT